jgi:hypothetical protein
LELFGPPPRPPEQELFGPPALAPGSDPDTFGADLQNFGAALAISGALTSAIGAFYQVDSQKYQLKSQALSLEFQRNIANINARAFEIDAAAILEAGRRQRLTRGFVAGQEAGRERVSQAARGISADSASAVEAQASLDFARDVDLFTIDANALRAANAARRGATDARNQAALAGVSARNVRASASALSPALAAGTSLVSSTGRISSDIARNRRLNRLFGGGG